MHLNEMFFLICLGTQCHEPHVNDKMDLELRVIVSSLERSTFGASPTER